MSIASTTDDAVVAELGRRVARHRLNRDWTQERLALESGVSLPTVSRLERGESTSLVSFLRVLRALDLMRDLARLVPDVPTSPVQELRSRRPAKQRASRRRG
jgi:transcriptional regulator with XRE-family HTH domain